MAFKIQNGRKLYVLRIKSTSQVIKRNTIYPNAVDDSTIVGLDPDLEYLAIDEDTIPDYDSRLFTIQTSEGPNAGVWKINHVTIPRSKDERKAALQNQKAVEVNNHVLPQELAELSIMGMGILLRVFDGIVITEEEQKVANRISDVDAILVKNAQNQALKEAQIDANEDPDLDAGWQPASLVKPV